MFRGSPAEVFSRRIICKHEEQTCRSAILTKQLCNFIEITPTHGCAAENLQHTCRTTSSRRAPLGTVLFLYVKRVLKDLNNKKVFFPVIKKKLFTRKIRLVIRFFNSLYFTYDFMLRNFFPKQHNLSQAIYLLAIYLNMMNLEMKYSVKQSQSLSMFFIKCSNQNLRV